MRRMFLLCLWASQISFSEAKALLDPTAPQGHSKQKQMQSSENDSLVLNAVFINGQSKYAIINGKRYQIEQLVQGNKLILIRQDQVILDTSSGKKTLFMNNHNIKKDINNGF